MAPDDEDAEAVLGPMARGRRWGGRLWRFVKVVLKHFRSNKGLLLASALGYNTLLSIVPLFAVILVVLSTVFDESMLVSAIAAQAEALLPGQGRTITDVFSAFVENREVVGGVGFVIMLFFSTIAFRMLEDAMAIVFHRQRQRTPHPLRAFVLPLAYVGLIGLGILGLTLVMITFDALPQEGIRIAGIGLEPALGVPLVKLLAFVGLVALLSSFYAFMPMVEVRPGRAIIGGFVAATLWEAVRSLLMWYFANLSLVDVVYGSLATVVVFLVGLEIAAIILLLGAQILAELELSEDQGRNWWEGFSEEAASTSISS
jgi:YihY family inner membrane protein